MFSGTRSKSVISVTGEVIISHNKNIAKKTANDLISFKYLNSNPDRSLGNYVKYI